jgi:dihydroorotase
VDWEILIGCITSAPREILGLPQPAVETGADANLTLLDPNAVWTLDAATNRSKSVNSPWWGKPVKGRVAAVFNNGKQSLHVE